MIIGKKYFNFIWFSRSLKFHKKLYKLCNLALILEFFFLNCFTIQFDWYWDLSSPFLSFLSFSSPTVPLCSSLQSHNECLSCVFTSPSCCHRSVSQQVRRLSVVLLWVHSCTACMRAYFFLFLPMDILISAIYP